MQNRDLVDAPKFTFFRAHGDRFGRSDPQQHRLVFADSIEAFDIILPNLERTPTALLLSLASFSTSKASPFLPAWSHYSPSRSSNLEVKLMNRGF